MIRLREKRRLEQRANTGRLPEAGRAVGLAHLSSEANIARREKVHLLK
ncbi:hypothetical protein ACFONL_03600 [Camelimonas fluminis]|uniref:Uncharacterized protein n=1 Tax=Camelimonas fluminis TaxID=1576911 RepID=A0ABV7UD75_9HYPH|nr:hypothetical protein [Camelimonas fluminis]